MAKPTDYPEWASNEGITTVKPPQDKLENGWLFRDQPPHEWQNWWQNNVYKWVNYFDIEVIDGNFSFTGDKTFQDQVTFEQLPTIPDTVPSQENQIVNKRYVDNHRELIPQFNGSIGNKLTLGPGYVGVTLVGIGENEIIQVLEDTSPSTSFEAYRFNGSNFVNYASYIVPSSATQVDSKLCYLSDNLFARIWRDSTVTPNVLKLQAYQIVGSTFQTVGNEFITNLESGGTTGKTRTYFRICTLSNTPAVPTMAIVSFVNDTLGDYASLVAMSFDGTDWFPLNNGASGSNVAEATVLNISGQLDCCQLDNNRIAVCSNGNNTLVTFDFETTTGVWSQIGTERIITVPRDIVGSYTTITGISSDTILLLTSDTLGDGTDFYIEPYQFRDEDFWLKLGTEFYFAINNQQVDLKAMSANRFAVAEWDSNLNNIEMQNYEMIWGPQLRKYYF